MSFKPLALAALLCTISGWDVMAETFDAEAQKPMIEAIAKSCRTDRDFRTHPVIRNLSASEKDRICNCFARKFVSSLTIMDIVNARMATGAEVRKVEEMSERKGRAALRHCQKRL